MVKQASLRQVAKFALLSGFLSLSAATALSIGASAPAWADDGGGDGGDGGGSGNGGAVGGGHGTTEGGTTTYVNNYNTVNYYYDTITVGNQVDLTDVDNSITSLNGSITNTTTTINGLKSELNNISNVTTAYSGAKSNTTPTIKTVAVTVGQGTASTSKSVTGGSADMTSAK